MILELGLKTSNKKLFKHNNKKLREGEPCANLYQIALSSEMLELGNARF